MDTARRAAIWGAVALLAILAFPVALIFVLGAQAEQNACSATAATAAGPGGYSSTQPGVSPHGANSIPRDWLPLLRAAGRQYGVPWTVLAGIASIETDFGRSTLPGVHSGTNDHGAAGPMQFGITGASGETWQAVTGLPTADVYQIRYAVPAAAKYIAQGLARSGGDIRAAILVYNHSSQYVNDVLARAARYGAGNFTIGAGTSGGATTTGPVAAFGDSVMLRSATALRGALQGADLSIDAVVSRQAAAIIDAIAAYKTAHHGLPATIIVQIGNNGPVTDGDLQRLHRIAANVKHLILVTIRVDQPWETEVNQLLAHLVGTWPAVTLADWNAAAAAHPDYLVDGVHPSPAGQRAYANTIAKTTSGGTAANAACPAGAGNPATGAVGPTPTGTRTFDGLPVAAWIVPVLQWARAHGWAGHVTSGYRDRAHEWQAATNYGLSNYPGGNPFGSNHLTVDYPGGAVDVSNPAQLNQVLRRYPGKPTLVWGAVIRDFVHFSSTGH